MITTIQVDLKTKKKLFTIVAQLQQELGRRVSYSEAIEYLLQKQTDLPSHTDFSSLYELQGILTQGEGKQLLKQLRDEDHKRERKLLRH